LSNQEIAERINLSPSPCLRRIRRLEESGVIRGYVALLDAQRLGLDLLAYVNVRLEKRGGSALSPRGEATHADLFRAAVQTWPEASPVGDRRQNELLAGKDQGDDGVADLMKVHGLGRAAHGR